MKDLQKFDYYFYYFSIFEVIKLSLSQNFLFINGIFKIRLNGSNAKSFMLVLLLEYIPYRIDSYTFQDYTF